MVSVATIPGVNLPDTNLTGYSLRLTPRHLIVNSDQISGLIRLKLDGTGSDTFFTTGSGPGELKAPGSVWDRGDTTLVFDGAALAIKAFSSAKKPLYEFRLPINPRAMDGDEFGNVIALVNGPNQYGFIFPESSSVTRSLGNRTIPASRATLDLVAAGGRNRFFVYDGTSGEIRTFDSTATLVRAPQRIPEWLYSRLMTHYVTATPPSAKKIVGNPELPQIKTMSGDGNGRAFLFYVTDDVEGGYGVRYDPTDGTFIRLGFPADTAVQRVLRMAWGASARDSLFAITRPTGTVLFKLEKR